MPSEFVQEPKVSYTIVVPTLNEVENIDFLIAGILEGGGDSVGEIIVVDDGSLDGTQERVEAWGSKAPVKLLCRSARDGLAGAVVAGARLAENDVVVVMDADLSHPWESLPALTDPVLRGAADMVIGSRYVPGGSTPGWPMFRRFFSKGAAALAWPLTNIHDSLSGFFAVRRTLIVELGSNVAGFKIGLEILVRGGPDVRALEIPIVFKDRLRGKSKMNGRVVSTYLAQLAGFFAGRVRRLPPASAAVLALWCAIVMAICVRSTVSPQKNTVFATYALAGQHWLHSERIYTAVGGFVYSPLAAALFAPLSELPSPVANTFWRFANVLLLTGSVWYWLRLVSREAIPRKRYWLVFLLLLPLSIGNINNGQANPIVIGLLIFAFACSDAAHWWLAAFCVAGATYLKLYPIVVGLLLVAMFPRAFTWRLAVALLVLGFSTFLLQHPGYVLGQYKSWLVTRIHDNRHLYELKLAPRDLWLLLHDLRIGISDTAYKALQAGSGCLIALYAVLGLRNHRPLVHVLQGLLALTSCWMVLLGPASESATYLLLAPAMVFACVAEFERKSPLWLRSLPFCSLCVSLFALSINSFTHSNRNPHGMVLQPTAAVLLALYTTIFLLRRSSEGGGAAPRFTSRSSLGEFRP